MKSVILILGVLLSTAVIAQDQLMLPGLSNNKIDTTKGMTSQERYDFALKNIGEEKYEEAKNILFLLVQEGSPKKAVATFGSLFENGWGVDQNCKTAFLIYLNPETIKAGECGGISSAINMIKNNKSCDTGSSKENILASLSEMERSCLSK